MEKNEPDGNHPNGLFQMGVPESWLLTGDSAEPHGGGQAATRQVKMRRRELWRNRVAY